MTEKEFTKIVNETKGAVLGAIKKYLNPLNVEYIDDIAQETYMRAYKALVEKKFRSESSISTWLFTIAKNECFRLNAKMEKERQTVTELGDDEYIAAKPEGGWAKETTQYFKELITKLPIKYRDVIELDVLGYRDKQIAEMLNISTGTVKSRNSRARMMIRQIEAQQTR